MDTDTFLEQYYEDLNGRITSIRLDQDECCIAFECDAFEDHQDASRLCFDIVCRGVQEMTATPGLTEGIWITDEHPLLLNYNSPHEALYFSSAPSSPDEIIGALYLAHRSVYDIWRPLSHTMNHGASGYGGLRGLLEAGHGLLASGPSVVIAALVDTIGGRMRLDRLPSSAPERKLKVLFFDETYVICEGVEVVEQALGKERIRRECL